MEKNRSKFKVKTKWSEVQSRLLLFVCFLVLLFFSLPETVGAQSNVAIEALPDSAAHGDFVVGPGKVELYLDPGQSQTVYLTIANRLGTERVFSISEEDFVGSNKPDQTVVLLGDDRSPYSLRDNIAPAVRSVAIPSGYRARIPVKITVPENAEPGGRYGSLIVSLASIQETALAGQGAEPSNALVTRVGALFFVRIKGEAKEDGRLENFNIGGNRHVLFGAQPIDFDLTFANDGNVSLNPSGSIKVTNILGTPVGLIGVEPWFALPQSLRFRQVVWTPSFLFGRYTAEASIGRGYGSTTDVMRTSFWVIPWKAILVAIAVAIILVWFTMKFVLRKK